jgi:hypothetical protein
MDPGLLTLGALALGASVLLPKFSKSRKEGFEVIPAPGYPEVEEKASEIYNNLTLASDPRSEAVRVGNMPEAEQQAYKSAVDQITAPINTVITSTGAQTTTEPTKNPVLLPDDSSILKRATFCESAQIDPEIFKNDQFARDCGVCLGSGTGFNDKPFSNVFKGMFILPEQKKAALDARNSKNEAFSKAKPSYGYCAKATGGVDHDYTFAVDEKELGPLVQRYRCKKDQTLEGSCATCLQDGSFTYVGTADRTLDTVSFTIFGNLAVITASMGNVNVDFNMPQNQTTVVLNRGASRRFNLVLNEGAFLNFSVSGWSGRGTTTNKASAAEFWGIITFPNSTGGQETIPLDRILLKDETTGAAPKFSKNFAQVNGIYCRKMLKPSGQDSMILTGQLPFLLVNNAPFEGIDCKGSLLQTLPSSVEKFGGDPCYKPASQGPGSWTDACLRDRIQTMGCTTSGNLYKNPAELRNLSMTQIMQTIQEHASKQYTENTSSQKCNGANISTPCDGFVRFDPEETPELSDQCIDFLYFNRGAEKPNIGPTYTGATGSFFSLDSNGKKIMCLPGAKLDPAARDRQLQNFLKKIYREGWNGGPGLESVKRYMDSTYNRAVNTGLSATLSDDKGGRKTSIERCFRTLANIPENLLPDAKLPNARYCQVRFPPGRAECIQISQLACFDNRNVNVAFGKQTSASSKLANDCGPERAVDGQLRARGHPFEFHNQCKANEWWLVDFGKTYPIKRVEYYNRGDCCQSRANGMLIELLDTSKNVIWTQTLNSTLIQKFNTFEKNFNV